MRLVLPTTIAAALVAALPLAVSAQQQQQQSTPPPAPTASGQSTTTPPPPAPPPPRTSDESSSGSGWWSSSPSRWVAAGFVGANYGASAANTSVDFGGQVGYLYKGIVGGELLADFAPTFEINNAFLADRPFVNAYMANAIFAVPIGHETQIQPYVSGGVGAVQLWSNMLNTTAVPVSGQTSVNETKGGSDIGFGILGFAGNIGVRGDVRYFRAFTSSTPAVPGAGTTVGDAFGQNLLSGLDFWRANIGIAVRW